MALSDLPVFRKLNGTMKIAFATAALQFGGSATFLLYLTDGLRQIGIASEVFSFVNGNPFAAEFAKAEIPVHTADEAKFIFEDRLSALYQKIARFEPTVVVANLGAEPFEMLRYMPGGVKRLGMIHDPVNQAAPRLYRANLDGIVCVNPSWVEVTHQIAPGLPCQYCAHGIPLPEAGQIRDPAPTAPLSLTYFGRLTEVKGAKLFPEIVKHLHLRKIPFRWAIYGAGPEENYLRQHLAPEIKTGEVVLSPFIPRHELFQTIRKHDVFIFASEIEGGPLTLLEAMSVGLVPICNDIRCLTQEVVTPETGFIISRSPEQYAEMFALLHKDRARLERMSAAARKMITQHYSLKAMAGRYVDFMKSLGPPPAPIAWPACITPKPMLDLPLLSRVAQSNALARQARRLMKRIRG
jgi:glycosyltransferase involved in cell wall biosynthesis